MFTYTKRRQEFKILVLLGLTFATTYLEKNNAQAQTASASGSATLTSGGTIVDTFDPISGVLVTRTITNGVITSVSGETVLPSGYFFNSAVVVTPGYGPLSTTNTVPVVSSLSIEATPKVTDKSASFSRAAAEILTNAASTPSSVGDIDKVTAIIRSGAGVNGLD